MKYLRLYMYQIYIFFKRRNKFDRQHYLPSIIWGPMLILVLLTLNVGPFLGWRGFEFTVMALVVYIFFLIAFPKATLIQEVEAYEKSTDEQKIQTRGRLIFIIALVLFLLPLFTLST